MSPVLTRRCSSPVCIVYRYRLGATLCKHEPVQGNHRSETIILVLVLFPFWLWPFWWKPRLWWIKSRGSRAPWRALPAANYVSAPLVTSRLSNGVSSGWDHRAKWEQGQLKRRPVNFSARLVSTIAHTN